MKDRIDEVRVPIEDIKDQHPLLYQEFRSNGVIATITLYSRKAHAQVYEYGKGRGHKLFYGSSALFKRWQETKKNHSQTGEPA